MRWNVFDNLRWVFAEATEGISDGYGEAKFNKEEASGELPRSTKWFGFTALESSRLALPFVPSCY